MGLGEDTKKLTEDILASYDLRAKEIRQLEKDIQSMLKEFQSEKKDMVEQLKKTFKQAENGRIKSEADRIKTFGNMKNEILAEQKNRNKEVFDLLGKFSKDHKDLLEQLRKTFKQAENDRIKSEADRIKTFGNMKNEILAEQKNRNKEVADLLKAHNAEREKMSDSWKTLSSTMSKRRSSKPIVDTEVKVRSVKEAIKVSAKENKESSGIGLGEKEYV